MTFEQLKYFIAAVKSNTFFDAAEELNITQSSLSKQIMKLEKELDVTLFDRTRRRAQLTEAGQAFYDEAVKMVAQYESMRRIMNEFSRANSSSIHLGTLPVLTQYDLTGRLLDFRRANPDISLTIDEVEEEDLIKGIRSGKYDLILCRDHISSEFSNDAYGTHPVSEDQLVAALPAGHPLLATCSTSSEFRLPLTALKDERFILMNRYTSVFKLCQEVFHDAGMEPNIARTARVESILSAVSAGEGVGLLPYSNFHVFNHENVVPVFLKPEYTLPLVLMGRREQLTKQNTKKLIGYLTNQSVL